MANHNQLGQWGESFAAQYLEGLGYRIVARNYRVGKAEIDLIVQKSPKVLVVVEVKTRSSKDFGPPQTFVTPAKIKMLTKAAHAYIRSGGHQDLEAGFDIIAILRDGPETTLEHLEDAFYPF
jgi:putative endonuclease